MTAALIALAVSLSGSLAAVIWFAHRIDAAHGDRAHAMDLYRKEYEMVEELLTQRGELQRRNAELDDFNRGLKQRVALLEGERNDAVRKFQAELDARLKAGTTADAAAAVDDILSAPLLPDPEA